MLRLQAFKFALLPNGERLRGSSLVRAASSTTRVWLSTSNATRKRKSDWATRACALSCQTGRGSTSSCPTYQRKRCSKRCRTWNERTQTSRLSPGRVIGKVKIQMDGLALSGAIRQPGGITSGLLVTRDKRKARRPFTVAFELSDSIQTPLLASYLVRAVAVLERHFLQRHTSKVRRASFVANHAGSLRGCFRPSFSTAMQRL